MQRPFLVLSGIVVLVAAFAVVIVLVTNPSGGLSDRQRQDRDAVVSYVRTHPVVQEQFYAESKTPTADQLQQWAVHKTTSGRTRTVELVGSAKCTPGNATNPSMDDWKNTNSGDDCISLDSLTVRFEGDRVVDMEFKNAMYGGIE